MILQNYKTVWNIPTPYNQYFTKRTLLVALNTSLVFLRCNTTIVIQIAHEFGLEISIVLTELQI